MQKSLPLSVLTLALVTAGAFAAGVRLADQPAPNEKIRMLSDARLKSNVEPLTDVLPRLESIRGVSFDWNERYEALGVHAEGREIGVIAQDVRDVFPELISVWGGDNDYLAVNYGSFSPILIQAVHELQSEITELEKRLQALEAAASQ